MILLKKQTKTKIMKIICYIGVVLLISSGSGCTTHSVKSKSNFQRVFPVADESTTETTRTNIPDLNIEATVELGQSMIQSISTATSITHKRVVVLNTNITHKGGNGGAPITLYIPRGELVFQGTDKLGKFYLTKTPSTFTALGFLSTPIEAGIYIPDDNSKSAQVFWIRSGSDNGAMIDDHSNIDYSFQNIEEKGETNVNPFTRELVYSGVSQNTVTILYREFKDGLARPAFSQELNYDLSKGKVIGYKGARYEIIKADNLGITYKVLKHLDS